MEPLAVFQALMIALAAAVAVEALRSTNLRTRIIFWVLFAAFAAVAMATTFIAAAWPAAAAAMSWLGSSPVILLLVFLTCLLLVQKPWRRQSEAVATTNPAELVGLETRLTGLIDGLKSDIRSKDETFAANIANLQEYGVATRALAVGEITGVKEGIHAIRQSLAAAYHRERLLEWSRWLDSESLRLGKPLAEGKVMAEDEWADWKSASLYWEHAVSEWAKYAAHYIPREPMDDIKKINAEALNEDWGAKAHQFPASDPEGLRVYKTFRIYVRNWAAMRDVVHELVRRLAFEGAPA